MFHPRPVAVAAPRRPGDEWLNGPLVWAVTERRQAAYLFPRDCPRVLLWCTEDTSDADRAQWFEDARDEMIAYVEQAWLASIRATTLYRYELPSASFEPLEQDDWMWVSQVAVTPLQVEPVGDLLAALAERATCLRVVESLAPLRDAWSTSLHVSGIRLRNARDWPA